MSTTIIDRRLNGKKKSSTNVHRYTKRQKSQVIEAAKEALTKRSITDKSDVEITAKPDSTTQEPFFRHGEGGKRERVYPGNKEFTKGDRLPRPPQGGQGGRGGQGEGEDDFTFKLTFDEFLDMIFDGCELPNMEESSAFETIKTKKKRAGFSTTGVSTNIHIERTLISGLGRKMAFGGKYKTKLTNFFKTAANTVGQAALDQGTITEEQAKRLDTSPALFSALFPEDGSLFKDVKAKISENGNQENTVLPEGLDEQLKKPDEVLTQHLKEWRDEAIRLSKKFNGIPFLDDVDMKFRRYDDKPEPDSRAVMFCLMDVSGSVNQDMKDRAKRFYLLQHFFLEREYGEGKVDTVFIRYHSRASEVDEQTFFYSTETGGTKVYSAIEEMRDIMKERYSDPQWNRYVTHTSDGDTNGPEDQKYTLGLLGKDILPHIRHYAYLETPYDYGQQYNVYGRGLNQESELWQALGSLSENSEVGKYIDRQKLESVDDVVAVFHRFYKKETGANADTVGQSNTHKSAAFQI